MVAVGSKEMCGEDFFLEAGGRGGSGTCSGH